MGLFTEVKEEIVDKIIELYKQEVELIIKNEFDSEERTEKVWTITVYTRRIISAFDGDIKQIDEFYNSIDF